MPYFSLDCFATLAMTCRKARRCPVILNLIQDLPPFPEKPNVDYQEIAGLRYATPAMTVQRACVQSNSLIFLTKKSVTV